MQRLVKPGQIPEVLSHRFISQDNLPIRSPAPLQFDEVCFGWQSQVLPANVGSKSRIAFLKTAVSLSDNQHNCFGHTANQPVRTLQTTPRLQELDNTRHQANALRLMGPGTDID